MPAAAEPALRAVIGGYDAHLPSLSVALPDGRTGWAQRNNGPVGGCFQAALATYLQIPLDEIEFTNIDELASWALKRELMVVQRTEPPADGSLWVGVTPPLLEGDAAEACRAETGCDPRHCFVGVEDRLYFDPQSGWVLPAGVELQPTTEVEYMFTVEPVNPT